MIDGMQFPWVWIIATEHDLAGDDLGDKVPQGFRRENQRVEIELVEVFCRLFSV